MEMGDITNLMDYTSSLASASGAEKTARDASSAKTDEKMLDACKEFETYLWEQVLKSMKSSSEVFSTEKEDQTVSYFKETAMTEVARQITEQNLGGNSLAMQMYEQMQRNQGISGDELRTRMAAAAGSSDNSSNGSDDSES